MVPGLLHIGIALLLFGIPLVCALSGPVNILLTTINLARPGIEPGSPYSTRVL